MEANPTGLLQLALGDAAAREKPEPIEFVEEARFRKDDFDEWQVSYNYAASGPKWRLDQSEAARAFR